MWSVVASETRGVGVFGDHFPSFNLTLALKYKHNVLLLHDEMTCSKIAGTMNFPSVYTRRCTLTLGCDEAVVDPSHDIDANAWSRVGLTRFEKR